MAFMMARQVDIPLPPACHLVNMCVILLEVYL